MKKYFLLFVFCIALMAFVTADAAPAAKSPTIRWPAVAGANYSSDPEMLLATLVNFRVQAEVPEVGNKLIALIASPAPYGLAGRTTAHAFKSLQPGQYDRVVILAPGHGPSFENCSVPAVDVFMTPLGPVPLDGSAIRTLMYSPLFQMHQLRYDGVKPHERIHEYEFAIESLLPYLQERLFEFKLVPVLVGDLKDPKGNTTENTMTAFANAIKPVIDERTLVVVASSFTHYGEEYKNTPFTEEIEENIAHLDRLAFEQILGLNLSGFRSYMKRSKNVIDGENCIQILLQLLPVHTQARLLAYTTSGTVSGHWDNSVSYGSFVFHDLDAPALSARPDLVRPLVLRKPEQTASPSQPTSPVVKEGEKEKSENPQ
ncbi:MAG: AmmeMemoRadiSam system protein B [Candidatus Hydrogenedens sp.]|jgi:AmmeMemoRadiSam system protein B|nr:AmmeMemoRadiSam system protein B [Candidatus Hydrogenedens sp.]